MAWFYIGDRGSFRYDLSRFMRFEEGLHDEFSSVFVTRMKELPAAGSPYSITTERRPDLYARDIYGDTSYWLVLMVYNNVLRIGDLTLGNTLEYPRRSDLESLYLGLRSEARTRGIRV